MASPTLLVRAEVPADSPATALAGKTVTTPVETIEQMVQRIAEARRAGAQPAIRISYEDSRWDRVVNASALAAILPAIVATAAQLAGRHTTSQVALVVAVLLALVSGGSLAAGRLTA